MSCCIISDMKTTPSKSETTTVPKSTVFQVTTLSKTLALIIFIVMPFVGGYIGYTYAPEKIVEIEKIVEKITPPVPTEIKAI